MKKLLVIFWLAATILTPGINIPSRYPVDPGKKLYLFVFSPCTITLTGHSQPRIDSELEGTFPGDETVLFYNRNEQGDYALTVKEGHREKLLWKLKIPRNFDLSVTQLDGDIHLSGLSGSIDVKSGDSDLILQDIQNREQIIKADLEKGDITLKDSTGNALLTTGAGSIEVINLTGNPVINAQGGDVTFRNVYARDQVVFIRNSGGDVDLSSVSDGADIINIGGNVKINTVNNFLIVKTVPGDITVKSLKGWIKARSSGGDIQVRMRETLTRTKNDIELTSLAGTVTLLLPEFFSMVYQAEIQGLNTVDQNFRITNEFTPPSDSAASSGILRRDRGIVYGGRNQVRITTSYGDIRILKDTPQRDSLRE